VARHLLWIALFALPAIVLWWHVWTGHPSSTLTCACGDPAQAVWFMAWPAWALAHATSIFFSSAVNVPHGANLLSNTSSPLVGLVLAPVSWLWGPVTATNVALTLSPALSAWACWVALRRFVSWAPAAIPGALVYGYSTAVMAQLVFGHLSLTVLVIPPLLFSALYDLVLRQERRPRREGARVAGLLILQFFISTEVLVLCLLLGAVGLVAVALAGRRASRERWVHALTGLGVGGVIAAAVLAYPIWLGLAGPESVTGVLFVLAPISGVAYPGFLNPGPYESFADAYVRFGGYLGRIGPPPNFLGFGLAIVTAGSVALTRRRPLTWLLVLLTVVAMWLALGGYLLGASPFLQHHLWLPWRYLSMLPTLQEILPDHFALFITLFLAFVLALGLNEGYARLQPLLSGRRLALTAGAATVGVTLLALVPIFVTFDLPLHVVPTVIPVYMRRDAPKLPAHDVLLTVPFAISGSDEPMLWQAVDGMHFRLAGGGLKTPNARGGPEEQGAPHSARRILSDLTIFSGPQPLGTAAEVRTIRGALRTWQVREVVIDGASRDPEWAAGFMTMVFGRAPAIVDHAWVWRVPRARITTPPALHASLYECRLAAYAKALRHRPLAVPDCILHMQASHHAAAS
jgi:dolichyl-phosphate beta-glucosyltransferase